MDLKHIFNKNYEEIVYKVLKKYPKCRDNKERLYVAVIAEIYGLDFVKNISLYNFFINFSNSNNVPSVSTISRLSQKIQNTYPEVRGIYYNKRHSYADKVKDEILDWNINNDT